MEGEARARFACASYEIPRAKGQKARERAVTSPSRVAASTPTSRVGSGSSPPTTRRRSFAPIGPSTTCHRPSSRCRRGTFSGGMQSSTASPNSGLLAAIVVTPAGPSTSSRSPGPSATVKAAPSRSTRCSTACASRVRAPRRSPPRAPRHQTDHAPPSPPPRRRPNAMPATAGRQTRRRRRRQTQPAHGLRHKPAPVRHQANTEGSTRHE